ncbi:MAG: methyltransferase family protein [Parachlamydiales bacterium]|nr:methyltransferase family protein [Parachlamydiales bacterium]
MIDLNTINFYNNNFSTYFERTFYLNLKDQQERFLKYLPVSATILDAGCGPGRDMLAFYHLGYKVMGFDASEEMVKYVTETLKLPATKGVFEEMDFFEEFNGIWALASLVHVSLNSLPDVINRLCRALKPNGVLFMSFKEGKGVSHECDRTFNYIDNETLLPFLDEFTILDEWIHVSGTEATRSQCHWLNIIVRKKP